MMERDSCLIVRHVLEISSDRIGDLELSLGLQLQDRRVANPTVWRLSLVAPENLALGSGKWCLHRNVPRRKARPINDAQNNLFKRVPL
jgi:hypothetical protein